LPRPHNLTRKRACKVLHIDSTSADELSRQGNCRATSAAAGADISPCGSYLGQRFRRALIAPL
jgi:hypothetical protein